MRTWILAALGVAGPMISAGCSSPAMHGAADAGPAPFTFEEPVAAGADEYLCQYVVPTSEDGYLVGVSHLASAGTHHILVFRTDLASAPGAGAGAGAVDCYAGAASPMQHARGEVYGSQARSGSFAFADGVGLPVRAGEPLLVQLHLSNAGASALTASISLTVTMTTRAPATAAGVFDFDDPFIDVPPGAVGHAAMRCLVPDDITIVSAASQDHAHAAAVAAYVDPPGGPPATTPFYTGLNAANPLPLEGDVPVAAGSHVRFGCDYQNVTGTAELLQGTDYQTAEMCALSGAYYPAMPAAAETCALAPDGFGVGGATCAQTLACVNACAPGSTPPPDLGLGTASQVDPCWQRCVVQSCPDASGDLLALVRCAQASCAAECATPSSAACAACQADQCPAESSACAADACGG